MTELLIEPESYDGFACHLLEADRFHVGRLKDDLVFGRVHFEALWALHPPERHWIKMVGQDVQLPRWQQAFGADYIYSRQVNRALPVPALLNPLHDWVKSVIDPRLNGLLLNWYNAGEGHYIGPHRDSTKNMVGGAPIVTVSFGEERVFRLRPYKREGARHDFRAADGTVFILPYSTNLRWYHEVPHAARYRGRRVSVTFRAFEAAGRTIGSGVQEAAHE